MKAEIINVGTELLLGDILNTNSQYLASQLANMGFSVYRQTVIGDNSNRLADVVLQAKKRCDLLIFTGGLGPTDDDLTKETVAKAFNDSLVYDDEEYQKIVEYFKNTTRPCTQNNKKQAFLPVNGGKFENDNGTAPGVYFTDNGCTAILLPGPPKELIPMFENKVVPFLQPYISGCIYSINLNVFGIGESNLETKIKNFLDMQNPTVALYAKHGEVRIRVTAFEQDKQQAKNSCNEICSQIKNVIGDYIYGTNDDTLESVLVELLKTKQLKISTCESCTGGMLSQRLTDVSGASQVFEMGVCSYSNRIKNKIVGVCNDTLQAYTEVSNQVASEMADGVLKLSGADYAVSTTGIAGPTGGTEQNPVGTVYIAVKNKDERCILKRITVGGRGRYHVKHMACQYALDMVRRDILQLEQLA